VIDLPKGLLEASGPYLPDVQRLYHLLGPLLEVDDPEDERPAVVLAIPEETPGDIWVGLRSSTEENGVFHRAEPALELYKDGWFSRLRTISTELWTPEYAKSTNHLLDEETFAYVYRDYLEMVEP
jgi:hypothetical protein